MELQDAIRRRRMVRNFSDRPIPPAVLDRILTNALYAPSAGFSQGWAFVVLEGPEQTRVFWDAATPPGRGTEHQWPAIRAAPALIVPFAHAQAYLDRYAEPDKAGTGLEIATAWPVPYWIVDTAFASMLMLLSAVDARLGALFFGIGRGQEHALLAALGVPAGFEPIGAVALGYPLPDTPSPSLARGRRQLADVVHRGRW